MDRWVTVAKPVLALESHVANRAFPSLPDISWVIVTGENRKRVGAQYRVPTGPHQDFRPETLRQQGNVFVLVSSGETASLTTASRTRES